MLIIIIIITIINVFVASLLLTYSPLLVTFTAYFIFAYISLTNFPFKYSPFSPFPQVALAFFP